MGCFGGPYLIQTLMAAACQAKQQKNPGAVVACIKQLDWMTGLGITQHLGKGGTEVIADKGLEPDSLSQVEEAFISTGLL